MPDMTVCESSPDPVSGGISLPTRQANALRLLLDKPVITPEEVALLSYRSIERAPGVGTKSIAVIRAWLNSHGYELNGLPSSPNSLQGALRKRKLERAIDYLRDQGYEVHQAR